MISVLIPTHNYNVYPLAKALEVQFLNSKITYEIICRDDLAIDSLIENEKINLLKHATFVFVKKGNGLSENRNKLASIAKYDYLLFIDGDSALPDKSFIDRYLSVIKNNIDIIYGGRIHPKTVLKHQKLRWKYGRLREDLTALERGKDKYKYLFFNNTLIKREFFNTIGFEKSITQYGHEDTILAYKISLKKASVIHINNPVLHNDIDSNITFLNKSKHSLENLNTIYKTNLIDYRFITFLKIFSKIKKFKLHYLAALFHVLFASLLEKQLTSKRTLIFIFNLFRLSYFSHINLKK